MKIVVFGAGDYGKYYIGSVSPDVHIVGVVDNYATGYLFGHPILKPQEITGIEYDRVAIALTNSKFAEPRISEVLSQLSGLSVPQDKCFIVSDYASNFQGTLPRIRYLELISQDLQCMDEHLAVAECGVFRGDFAHHINRLFPNRCLHLFDSFEGFNDSDIKYESRSAKGWLSTGSYQHFLGGGAEISLLKCMYRNSVILHKGYVPDTLSEVDERQMFCFANLDMDLYKPMLSALLFFASRMPKDGIIMCHDYYSHALLGVKQAVLEFAKQWNFLKLPSGDNFSLTLTNFERR